MYCEYAGTHCLVCHQIEDACSDCELKIRATVKCPNQYQESNRLCKICEWTEECIADCEPFNFISFNKD